MNGSRTLLGQFRPLIALAAALFCSAHPALAAGNDSYFAGLDALPADERYRQLSLMLLVSDGADEELIETLEKRVSGTADSADDFPDFDFDQYTTPLIRIVDQQTMLAGATRLFRFTRDHAPDIAARLERLGQTRPELSEPGEAITEDAIIIRNAIADSIDYAQYAQRTENESDGPAISRPYRDRTIYLRNNMEYALFSAELERITREALASVGVQTDAYERMFDDEVEASQLDKKISAAEYVYGWDREFDERAAKMAEEILNNIWDRESGDLDP